MAGRNCLEGYLTPSCWKCHDWSNGGERGYGCACHFPIDWCPAFAAVMTFDAINIGTRIADTNGRYGEGVVLKKWREESELWVQFDNGTKAWVYAGRLKIIAKEEAE